MSRASRIPAATVRDAAPLFAALGDETRLRLVMRLSSNGPESTARLSATSAVTRQAVTKHLMVLSKAGLVQDGRRGRGLIWTIKHTRLADAREYIDKISLLWDDALGRLKNFVEG
jgi:DNA-binding transcriptional ArsR family regulator